MSLLAAPFLLLSFACGDKDDTGSGETPDDEHVWGYSSDNGAVPPDQWYEYWPACDGDMQSPLDVNDGVLQAGGEIELGLLWTDTTIEVENNGHNLEWKVDGGSVLLWQDTAYQMSQFHFHTPSEHTLDGVAFDMELHLVHQDPVTGNRLVIGLWIQEGPENPFLSAIGWDALPTGEGEVYTADELVALVDAMPQDIEVPTVYRYPGSLTTPPCDENVQWIVVSTPTTATAAQIAEFQAIIDSNARPVQAPGTRKVNESTVVAPE